MIVLALDPSVNHLGWSIMNNDRQVPEYLILTSCGTIDAPTASKQEELVDRIDWMLSELDDIPTGAVTTIVIECPETWGAYKSMASSRSGSLQMLTILVGALTHWACDKVGVNNVKLIKVSQWKGQLPKRVTQERMESKYRTSFATDHESDAVGLGDYILGKEQNEHYH